MVSLFFIFISSFGTVFHLVIFIIVAAISFFSIVFLSGAVILDPLDLTTALIILDCNIIALRPCLSEGPCCLFSKEVTELIENFEECIVIKLIVGFLQQR